MRFQFWHKTCNIMIGIVKKLKRFSLRNNKSGKDLFINGEIFLLMFPIQNGNGMEKYCKRILIRKRGKLNEFTRKQDIA